MFEEGGSLTNTEASTEAIASNTDPGIHQSTNNETEFDQATLRPARSITNTIDQPAS